MREEDDEGELWKERKKRSFVFQRYGKGLPCHMLPEVRSFVTGAREATSDRSWPNSGSRINPRTIEEKIPRGSVK